MPEWTPEPKGSELKQQHQKHESRPANSTISKSWNDCCCAAYVPPYSTRICGGSSATATAFFTPTIACPRLVPSRRAETSTSRCRFSRRISVCPGRFSIVAREPSVAVVPAELTIRCCPSLAENAILLGETNAYAYARLFTTSGVGAVSPCSNAPHPSQLRPA